VDSLAGGAATIQTTAPSVPDTVSVLPKGGCVLHCSRLTAGWCTHQCCITRTQDEFVMVETTGEDGSALQIIYRNGGDVRASCVEQLCDKVRYVCVLQVAACPPVC
jgi:hypothetical protein